jgi:hypothetical protein
MTEVARCHFDPWEKSISSVLAQKFAKEVGGVSSVMLAKVGIQKQSIFLDSGSRYPGL